MINTDLRSIDEVIASIKAKDDHNSSFRKELLHKFEFNLFLCLDIVRLELQLTQSISDDTALAISRMSGFHIFEYFYRDFPEVYKEVSTLFLSLGQYNEKIRRHELQSKIEGPEQFWNSFFAKKIPELLNS